MSIHEQLQNLDFEIPPFHREKIDIGNRILGEKIERSDELGTTIRSIWGENPIVVADYRHAFLDPWSYAVVGDLLFAKFLQRTQFVNKDIFHLLYEPHPTGIGSINLAVPNGEGLGNIELSRGSTPNIFTSEAFTSPILNRLYFMQNKYGEWKELGENLAWKIKESTLPNKDRAKNRCQDNLSRLKVIYDKAIEKWINNGSLNDFVMEINHHLVSEVFGIDNVNYLPAWQSYHGSDYAVKLWKTLELFQNSGLWNNILATLFARTKGEQFLFVGGDAYMRRWVDCSLKKGFSLKEARIDAPSGRPNGAPISNTELLNHLKERALLPTNTFQAVVLACVAQYIPLVRNGNDYGKGFLASKCWNYKTYHQLYADNLDGWPVVMFKRRNFVTQIEPHLASLYIWNPGGSYYQEHLRNSLATGKPINVNLDDIAERL